jgi:hypothetical protein
MTWKISVLACLLPLAVIAAAPLPAEAAAQYRHASAQLQSGAYSAATEILNSLAGQYPRVPEIFAARCSAQLGLRHAAAAEADCNYALVLRPNLASAVYGLAMAEDSQGKSALAAGHYRQYAALNDPQAIYRDHALARANQLDPSGAPLMVPPPPPPPGGAPAPMAVQPSGQIGTLILYRNHHLGGGGWGTSGVAQITLYLDGKLVGDIGHDQFVEIQAAPGSHVIEARFAVISVFAVPQVLTMPVNLVANGQTYLNFDTVGGTVQMVAVTADKGRKEVAQDCQKAFTRRM